jgi:hypothetical protein
VAAVPEPPGAEARAEAALEAAAAGAAFDECLLNDEYRRTGFEHFERAVRGAGRSEDRRFAVAVERRTPAAAESCRSVMLDRSVSRGRKRRIRLLAFSTAPFCQGEFGSQNLPSSSSISAGCSTLRSSSGTAGGRDVRLTQGSLLKSA